MTKARERLIVAIDLSDGQRAVDLIRELKDDVRYFKVGLELHSALGPRILELIYGEGGRVFLDLKYHDIPSQVARSAEVVTGQGVWAFSVHVMGGVRMMLAAKEASAARAESLKIRTPGLFGLTVLTHIDQDALNEELQVPGDLQARVVWQAHLARESGLQGCIASPREVGAIRSACGPNFEILTAGIRPTWARGPADQRRVLSPSEALRAGADRLIVGRPITTATKPVEAARRILSEMEEVLA